MHLVFYPALEGTAWPGPLTDKQAALGEAWLGPDGLLDILETQLGLGGLRSPSRIRAARLIERLIRTKGFWSRSTEVDPFGVAATLLSWRDSLMMHGWKGKAHADRLDSLSRITRDAEPGTPDRLLAVLAALRKTDVDIARITLVEAHGDMPSLWQRVLNLLAEGHTEIESFRFDQVSSGGDLGHARSGAFDPAGDGSLQLIRPAGPVEAAEDLAAWLAAQDTTDGIVIIGSDAILDAALHRHGLPTTGGSATHRNSLSQILPLVLAMGWNPPDPERAVELLSLPMTPIPRGVGAKLIKALQEWPAVGNAGWNKALASGLEYYDGDRRTRIAERLQVLLTPAVDGPDYPVAEMERRLKVANAWMGAMRSYTDDDPAPWDRALGQVDLFRQLVAASGLTALTRPQIQRLVDDATASADADIPHPPKAGLASVRDPGSLLGSADTVLWWNFTRGSAPGVDAIPLSPAELAALTDADVVLPGPAQLAEQNATRWRRPLQLTRQRLLLFCPEKDGSNEDLFPHPLWDEIAARTQPAEHGHRLVKSTPTTDKMPDKELADALALPSPRRDWSVEADSVPHRKTESPSSLEKLIGCPLAWALQYAASLYGGASASLPAENNLWGSLVHHILEQVFVDGLPETPEKAERKAKKVFDAQAPQLAAPLYRVGSEFDLARVRQIARRSAHEITRQLRSVGLDIISMEKTIEGQALGQQFNGQPDMVVGPPKAVVDLKWSGAKYRTDMLKAGTAGQLASYSYLLREGPNGRFPAAAFFILTDQRMLTTDGEAFPEAEVFQGSPPDEIWLALRKAWERARAQVDGGDLDARGVPDENGAKPPKPGIVDGTMVLKPGCMFCDYRLLCGLDYGEEA